MTCAPVSLAAGTRLAHYDVLEPIGKGGMGEVYRARDRKLGRDVAIKVLPPEFAENEDRLARFEREARLLAQLNHTNIATLHGLEEHDGQKFLVMELVEDETLAERIARGPIPLDEAIPLFIQIAEGLEAAHVGLDGKPKILYLPAALSSTRLVPPLPQKDLWSGSTVEVDSRRFSKAMPMSTPASPPTAGAP